VEEAFRVFTADAQSWWPTATHSIYKDVKEIVFEEKEGGEVYEVSTGGEKGHWAKVVTWEPPSRLVLDWNILEREARGTELEVRFVPSGAGTRVELEHRGWENIVEAAQEKRNDYETGWEYVLGVYGEHFG
jgi:uncharacterized protein YndB with AHSA1/START domain